MPQTMRVGGQKKKTHQKTLSKFNFIFDQKIQEEDKEQSRDNENDGNKSEGHISVDVDLEQININ